MKFVQLLNVLAIDTTFVVSHIAIFPKFVVGINTLENAYVNLVFDNIFGASIAEIFPVNDPNILVVLFGVVVHLDKGIPPNFVISKLGINENFTLLNFCT